jgi:hypothetical protein
MSFYVGNRRHGASTLPHQVVTSMWLRSVLLFSVLIGCLASPEWHSACRQPDGSFELRAVKDTQCAATGYHSDKVNQTGWGEVYISTSEHDADLTQAFAAGWLEAALTHERIYQSKLLTFFSVFTNSTVPPKLHDFLKQNLIWTRQQLYVRGISTAPLEGVFDDITFKHDGLDRTTPQSSDDVVYWMAVAAWYAQLKGMFHGYQRFADPSAPLSWFDLHIVQVGSDCEDLLPALGLQQHLSTNAFSQHCSSLVKLLPDFSDVYISHVTWSSYSNMLRQWKLYRMPFSFAKTKEMQMSSYPGELWSNDDFYTLKEQQMVVQETVFSFMHFLSKYIYCIEFLLFDSLQTNAILNMTILSSTLSPFVLFVGLRTQLANRLATNGADWASYFAPYNSGTYNNEFQIVDLKQFQQFQAPQTGDGLLFIVSQIPSDIRSADMSDFLAHELYWASYNRPFFPDQYSKMGYDYWNNTYPAYFSYAHDPRANIFRREQQRVSTLEDMQHVMTFNQWQTDPFSLGNAGLRFSFLSFFHFFLTKS